MKQAMTILWLVFFAAVAAQAADPAALLTRGKLAVDTGDRAAATTAFEMVAEDAAAPAALRWEALLRLGLVRRDGGDERGGAEAFARVWKDYREDKDAVAQLVLALGGAIPGAERWDAIWQKVVVTIDPSRTGGPWAKIEWPEVPVHARPTGPGPGPRSSVPHAEIPGFVARGTSSETSGSDADESPRAQGQNISLDFKDGDLNDVFRLFADITGLNVVVHPGVQGKVTITFHDIPWDDALGRILAPNGLSFDLAGSVLEIARPEELPPHREFAGKPTQVDFRQVDLRDALSRVAKSGGRTVTVPPGVAGTVTLKLSDIPWDQAFDLVARLNGLTWKDDGKTLRVELRADTR
jgi:hypothetical protein